MPGTGDYKRRVAIYGGSFNPPHICHQLTLLYVLETCPVDEVWLVPCNEHAFGKDLAPFELRRSWCEVLVQPFGARCRVSDIEQQLGGESRSIDTLEVLVERFPNVTFSLVLGSDIRAEREQWKRFDELERRFPIFWIGRQGFGEALSDGICLPDISSTQIREAFRSGKPLESFIPSRVLDTIRASGYRW